MRGELREQLQCHQRNEERGATPPAGPAPAAGGGVQREHTPPVLLLQEGCAEGAHTPSPSARRTARGRSTCPPGAWVHTVRAIALVFCCQENARRGELSPVRLLHKLFPLQRLLAGKSSACSRARAGSGSPARDAKPSQCARSGASSQRLETPKGGVMSPVGSPFEFPPSSWKAVNRSACWRPRR